MKFVCQVVSGEKLLVHQSDMENLLIPPRMQNFSINGFWRELRNDRDLVRYFPDYYQKTTPDREFFYKVR